MVSISMTFSMGQNSRQRALAAIDRLSMKINVIRGSLTVQGNLESVLLSTTDMRDALFLISRAATYANSVSIYNETPELPQEQDTIIFTEVDPSA